MNIPRIITAILCFIVFGHALAKAQDIDTELSNLAEKLAGPVTDHAKTKVTVLDFSDLDGGSSELGKYIAEQLTVNLVMGKRQFSVLDRANLRKILAEHKLTSQGLVDPENAKKLGMFAGVDAMVIGTIIPKGSRISLTAKIITTDTAEIIGAARAEFDVDQTVQQLLAKPASNTGTASDGGGFTDESAKVVKTFGDMRVEVQSLHLINGRDYILSLTVANQNPNRNLFAAMNMDGIALKSSLIDPGGYEFLSYEGDTAGIASGENMSYLGFQGKISMIRPTESISGTIKFTNRGGRGATPGPCRLQLELLNIAIDGYGKVAGATVNNVMAQLSAD